MNLFISWGNAVALALALLQSVCWRSGCHCFRGSGKFDGRTCSFIREFLLRRSLSSTEEDTRASIMMFALWYFMSTLVIPSFESGREFAPQTVMFVFSIARHNARASARPTMSLPQPESGQVKMDLKGPEDW